MAFPNNGILDNFNRANEGPPPSTNWSSTYALGQLSVLTNQCVPEDAGQTRWQDYWNTRTSNANSEVYATVITAPLTGEVFLACRLNQPAIQARYDGYGVICSPSSGTGVYRVDDDVWTGIGVPVDIVVADGEQFGVDAIGTTITCYVNGASLDSASDATYTQSGFLALGTNEFAVVFDNFGGGVVAVKPSKATIEIVVNSPAVKVTVNAFAFPPKVITSSIIINSPSTKSNVSAFASPTKAEVSIIIQAPSVLISKSSTVIITESTTISLVINSPIISIHINAIVSIGDGSNPTINISVLSPTVSTGGVVLISIVIHARSQLDTRPTYKSRIDKYLDHPSAMQNTVNNNSRIDKYIQEPSEMDTSIQEESCLCQKSI